MAAELTGHSAEAQRTTTRTLMASYTLKRQIYERVPTFLKYGVRLLPFPLLAGRAYRATLGRASWFESATRDQIRRYQEVQLRELFRYATSEVPAYRSLAPIVERLAPFEALSAFPLLDKDALQGDMPKYLPRNFADIPHYECATGGTSGNQLKFFLDDVSQSVETAFMHRQWRRVGYSWRARKATFRGVEFPRLDPECPWQPNPVYNELQFSPSHMNAHSIERYVTALAKYRPQFVHGYPSALSMLAKLAEAAGHDLRKLSIRAALLGSEAVSAEQRCDIERVFGTRVFSWYGHSERVILGGECEHGASYHQFPDYGILEVIDELSGQEVKEGESGELVGTGLLNRCLPLIRYRTGDRARRLAPTCACGRAFDRFDQVEGRWGQEYIIGKSGSRIFTTALNMHGSVFERVVRYQYVQRYPGRVELRLVVMPNFTHIDQERLVEAFARKVGSELEVKLVVCDSIPLTSRGKLRRVVRESEG